MARKRIKTFVAHHPETGKSEFVSPSDDLPEWLDEGSLNPGLFAPDDYVDEDEDVDLESMTVRQLVALASRKNIELFSTRKADIIEALKMENEDAGNG